MGKNKIVIAGGTGFLGNSLIRKFYKTDTEVVILSRSPKQADHNIRYVVWDARNLDHWQKELESAAAVINLCGKSVNCRYTERNKKEIIESRVLSSLVLGKAIQNCAKPPKVWINAGSAAIFGDAGDEFKIETSEVGNGFSPDVCKKWERSFYEVDTPSTRKVFLRIGMVLQLEGGVLKPFSNMVRLGLGGKIGSGNQYITWIHEADFVSMIEWIIKNEEIRGIIHCASPEPVTNKQFMKEIRTAFHMPFGLPTPAFLLKIGAVFIGTESELVLSGRRVVSKVLADKKFNFKFPDLQGALHHLIK